MNRFFRWISSFIASAIAAWRLAAMNRQQRRAMARFQARLRTGWTPAIAGAMNNRVRSRGARVSVAITDGGVAAGDPALAGQMAGVVESAKDGSNNAVLATEGVYNLSVKGVGDAGNSAVAVGDVLAYYTADTPKLSKKTAAGGGGLVPVDITAVPTGIPATVPGVTQSIAVVPTGIPASVPAGFIEVQIAAAPTGIPGGNVAANTTSNVALTAITGLLATDILVGVQKPTTQTGLFILPADLAQGGVTGAGAATVKYVNDTVAGITPTGGDTYVFTVLRAAPAPTFAASLTGITGLLATDQIIGVSKAAVQAGLILSSIQVTGAGAATLTYMNSTSAAIVPTAGEIYTFTVLRAGGATVTQALTGITGLLATDIVIAVQKAATQAGLSLGQFLVTGAGAGTLEYVNTSPAAIVPTGGESYIFTVLRAAGATGTGVKFGFALAAVNSGATATIPVKLAGSN